MPRSNRPRPNNNKHPRLLALRQVLASYGLRIKRRVRIWARQESGRRNGVELVQPEMILFATQRDIRQAMRL
jgi:hypothetical protein